MRISHALLLVCALPLAAHAGDVYKCTNAAGTVAFQDHPCASGDKESTVHLTASPVQPAPPSDNNAESATGSPAAAATPAPAAADRPVPAPAPANRPPPMWVCTRPEDGSTYISHDGASTPRLVPGGILGMPGKSLGEAYGSANGVGVSAPGVRKIPVDASPQAAAAGDYVAVQDKCVPATHDEACDYLRKQYHDIHEKLRHAFKSDAAALEPQLAEVDRQLDGC